jgi:hypothetical protein
MREISDYLSAHRIFYVRMNVFRGRLASGAYMRQGVPGMSDFLAIIRRDGIHIPVWIEAKSRKGAQSFEQSIFEQSVNSEGHLYVVVRDSYELEAFLKLKGVVR